MRADRRCVAIADPAADHAAAGGARADLGGHFRFHAVVERVHLRAGVHSIDRQEDGAGGDPDRAGDRRRVSVGRADGGLAAGVGASGADLLVLRRVLRLVDDGGGQRVGVTEIASAASRPGNDSGGRMKIERVETLQADAGWRMFSFLKVSTSDGIVGWSEFNESFGSAGLSDVIRKLAPVLIGKDPRRYE